MLNYFQERDDYDVWIMVLRHFCISWILFVIPKWTPWELERPWRLLPPFNGEHLTGTRTDQPAINLISPNGNCMGSHMDGWKYTVLVEKNIHDVPR